MKISRRELFDRLIVGGVFTAAAVGGVISSEPDPVETPTPGDIMLFNGVEWKTMAWKPSSYSWQPVSPN